MYACLVDSRLCKADSIVSQVKLGVVRADKNISKYPNLTHRSGNVHSHKTGQADGLSHLLDLHDVVIRGEREVNTTDSEDDSWKGRHCGTICKIKL